MTKAATKKIEENVILFDGVCNLCNGAINFLIDRDKDGIYKFAPLQSEYGQRYLTENGLPLDEFDSIVLLEDGHTYSKSTAALRIAKHLSGAWPLLYGFIILPRFVRDAVYDFIANNRYKFFGKQDQCRVPTPELQAKFLG